MNSGFLRLVSGVAIAVAAPLMAQQSAPVAERLIRVGWQNSPPTQVAFDGGDQFTPAPGYFEGRYRRPGSQINADLAVGFGDYQILLKVVANPEDNPLPIRVYKATYTQCDMTDVQALYATPISGTVDANIALLMKAHRLLSITTTDRCPPAERRKLIKIYFRASCALSNNPNTGLALSEDARELYRGIATTKDEKEEAESCTGKAQSRPVRRLLQRITLAKANHDVQQAQALTDELIELSESADWKDGFDALNIDSDYAKTLKVDTLYDLQIDAGKSGKLDTAIELNNSLSVLKQDRSFVPAFGKAKVSEALLRNDLSHYQALQGN